MTDALWVYIRSWHIVRSHPFGDAYETLCGKMASGPEYDTLAHQKEKSKRTCEACLGIWARREAI